MKSRIPRTLSQGSNSRITPIGTRRARQCEKATRLQEQSKPQKKRRKSTTGIGSSSSLLIFVEMKVVNNTTIVPDYIKFLMEQKEF